MTNVGSSKMVAARKMGCTMRGTRRRLVSGDIVRPRQLVSRPITPRAFPMCNFVPQVCAGHLRFYIEPEIFVIYQASSLRM
jgi:hypothetical protein